MGIQQTLQVLRCAAPESQAQRGWKAISRLFLQRNRPAAGGDEKIGPSRLPRELHRLWRVPLCARWRLPALSQRRRAVDPLGK